jgi:hypothetical protein
MQQTMVAIMVSGGQRVTRKEENMIKRILSAFVFLAISAGLSYADIPLVTDASITATYGYAAYPTGTKGFDPRAANVGDEYVFLAGVADCDARCVVAIDHDGTSTAAAVLLTETEGAKGRSIAVAMSAATAGLYGWFQVCGTTSLWVLASDAADAEQLCTTTGGAIDDAGTTPLHELHLVSATSGTGTAYIRYPHTGN